MSTRRRTFQLLSVVATGALGVAGCGGSDNGSDARPDDDTPAADVPLDDSDVDVGDGEVGDGDTDDGEVDDTDNAETAVDVEGDADASESPTVSGGGDATLTLANGETFQFEVRCVLEPQIAAGSEILFTVGSIGGDSSLDITQFGDEGPVTGISSVTVYDGSSFEDLWGASSFYEAFGGTLELSLDGSTVSGSGTFFAGNDPAVAPDGVEGDVVANC